jgi:hypothetical protein
MLEVARCNLKPLLTERPDLTAFLAPKGFFFFSSFSPFNSPKTPNDTTVTNDKNFNMIAVYQKSLLDRDELFLS